MIELLGYCLHVASVRLHEAAVGLLGKHPDDEACSPWIAESFVTDCVDEVVEITLADVAPRLAAACDTVRGHVERVRRRIGL